MDPTDRAELICSPATLIQALPGLVYCARVDRHWTMEYVSNGSLDLTGYHPGELLRNNLTSFEEIIHPEDREAVRDEVMLALHQGRRYAAEYRILHRNGSIRWVSERGAALVSDDASMQLVAGHIQDATAQKQAEATYKEAERRYRSIFDNVIEGIFQSTPDNRFVTANPALAHMYGYESPDELIHSVNSIDTELYVDPQRRAYFLEIMERDGMVLNFESQVYRRDRSVIWISENARAVKNANGELRFFEGTVEDISKRKLQEAVAQFQATHDSLTGLLNRNALSKRLEAALEARPPNRYVAVLYVDVDQFKYVNDSLGHQIGDQYLRIVASRLCSCLRECDSVARQGGDEFILLLDDLASHEDASFTAQRILTSVAQPWHINGIDVQVTCSIGISVAPSDAHDADTLLRHADAAMFRAKALGRNNYRYFTANLSRDGTGRLDWINRLRNALANNEFLLHYQPKIEVLTGRVVGVEALLRWRTADGGMIPPGDFISLAEETGLIVPIGDWVLRQACLANSAWQAAGYHPLPVSVNISAIQLERADLVNKLTDVLAETGLPPQYLELEITESALMSDADQSIATLKRLRALGVRSSIDDFGTGYSSLSHLKRFAVDTLKIDRSFISNITTDRDNAGIVQAIISLAHTLGLTVVAEGVETADEYRYLSARGCDQIQGYFTGRPVPATELITRLRPLR
ncbi:MAG: EAL domain-containing protein [Burkholderiaceae bacterium]